MLNEDQYEGNKRSLRPAMTNESNLDMWGRRHFLAFARNDLGRIEKLPLRNSALGNYPV